MRISRTLRFENENTTLFTPQKTFTIILQFERQYVQPIAMQIREIVIRQWKWVSSKPLLPTTVLSYKLLLFTGKEGNNFTKFSPNSFPQFPSKLWTWYVTKTISIGKLILQLAFYLSEFLKHPISCIGNSCTISRSTWEHEISACTSSGTQNYRLYFQFFKFQKTSGQPYIYVMKEIYIYISWVMQILQSFWVQFHFPPNDLRGLPEIKFIEYSLFTSNLTLSARNLI